jgi:hypothetical protein
MGTRSSFLPILGNALGVQPNLYHVICPKYLPHIIRGFNASGEGTGYHSLEEFLSEFVLQIYL